MDSLLADFKTIGILNGPNTISGKTLDKLDNGTAELQFAPVRLFRQSDGALIKETISNSDGDYQFNSLDSEVYFIVSHYVNHSKNGEMADNIVPQRAPVYDQIID